MKNGRYTCLLRATRMEVTFTAYNGSIKLWNGRYISEAILKEHYTEPTRIVSEKKTYNIHWIVGGVIKEVINCRASWPVCKHKINTMKGKYTFGKLIPIRAV